MGSNPTLSAVGGKRCLNYGEVLEWPNRRDWKSRVPSQGEPWVRIPPSPPCSAFCLFRNSVTDELLILTIGCFVKV